MSIFFLTNWYAWQASNKTFLFIYTIMIDFWSCHVTFGVTVLLLLCAGQYGRWTTDSCRVVSDNGATTQCVCTQLGHFSLLFVSDTTLTIAWSYSANHAACVCSAVAEFIWPNYTIILFSGPQSRRCVCTWSHLSCSCNICWHYHLCLVLGGHCDHIHCL